jgi:hypothetical protein
VGAAAAGKIFDARAPHRATRAVVENEGQAFVPRLYAAFDAFNARHFAGRLEAPLILVTPTAPRSRGDYQAKDVHGLQSLIRLHPFTCAMGELFALDVLLHEMVHAWSHEIAHESEDGYEGHGPKFASKCNVIGEQLGLPRVSPKGRQGLANCSRWPVCVRPPGYYDSEAAELERGKCQRPRVEREDLGAGELVDERDDGAGEDLVDPTPCAARIGLGTLPDDLAIARAVCLRLAKQADRGGFGKVARSLRRAARYIASHRDGGSTP